LSGTDIVVPFSCIAAESIIVEPAIAAITASFTFPTIFSSFGL
jgi:hypothetical protein